MACGRMECSTALALIRTQRAKSGRESGKKAEESNNETVGAFPCGIDELSLAKIYLIFDSPA